MAETEIIKDSPDSPEPPNKKPLIEMDETPPAEKSKGPVSLLSPWSNRINTANSRKHQEFARHLNSVNNRAELYQHLKRGKWNGENRIWQSQPVVKNDLRTKIYYIAYLLWAEFDISIFTARLYSYVAWIGFYIFKILQLTLSFLY